jgi:hypothetical protein
MNQQTRDFLWQLMRRGLYVNDRLRRVSRVAGSKRKLLRLSDTFCYTDRMEKGVHHE